MLMSGFLILRYRLFDTPLLYRSITHKICFRMLLHAYEVFKSMDERVRKPFLVDPSDNSS